MIFIKYELSKFVNNQYIILNNHQISKPATFMKKVITNVASVQLKPECDVMEVYFKEMGSIHDYQFTMVLVSEMALIHKINKFILIKYNYSDINTSQFLFLIKKGICLKINKVCEVVIQTKIQALRKLRFLLNSEQLFDPKNQIKSEMKINLALDEEKTFEVVPFDNVLTQKAI